MSSAHRGDRRRQVAVTRPSKSAGRPARDAAVAAVISVISGGKTTGAALDDALSNASLEQRDAAFAAHLARTTLRRYRSLLAMIDGFMPRGRPANSGPLNAILATAAAQLTLLKLPAHAVINIAVEQTQGHRRSRNFKGLTNAVLRKVAEGGIDRIAQINAAQTDIPEWLRRRWADHYGEAAALQIADACLQPASLDITPKTDAAALAAVLGGVGLATGSVRCETGVRIDTMPGFADGQWWVQDAAAALPALLLAPQAGEVVLDLCAAPGGKTMQLATTGARVTAVDQDATRLARIRENLERTNLQAELVAADATSFQPPTPVDRILVDVPCSATGTIRRHPDILHLKRAGDVTANAETQAVLLDHALAILKPGGTLVYCSCSLEPEEGPDQVAAALQRHPTVTRRKIAVGEAGVPTEWITAEGDLRTRPDFSVPIAVADTSVSAVTPELPLGLDGFYASRLVKG